MLLQERGHSLFPRKVCSWGRKGRGRRKRWKHYHEKKRKPGQKRGVHGEDKGVEENVVDLWVSRFEYFRSSIPGGGGTPH